MRVLLLANRDALKIPIETMLEVTGRDVDSCNTGDEALAAAKSATPDLAICDLDVKDKSAEKVISMLPENVPVLIVAGDTEAIAEDHPISKRLGGAKVVGKDVGMLEVKKIVDELEGKNEH